MKIIAEFDNGEDALMFARAKFARDGRQYEVTPGIDRPYAVRRTERVTDTIAYEHIPVFLRKQAS